MDEQGTRPPLTSEEKQRVVQNVGKHIAWASENRPMELCRGESLLTAALAAAVPLWIERVRNYSEVGFRERAQAVGAIVAEKGDALQFRGKSKKGREATREAFNALAEGLALAAFISGGIDFVGLHFEAKR